MISIGIKSDVDQLAKAFDDMAAKQIPYATSVALNLVAGYARTDLRAEMQKVFDRPRTYTLNSLYVSPASKSKLVATVGHKDQASSGTPAAQYLQAEMTGGPRQLTPFEKILQDAVHASGAFVPATGARRDAYGGVAKSIRDLIRRAQGGYMRSDPKGYFIVPVGAKSHLEPGIYQRIPIKTKVKKTRKQGRVVSVQALGGGSRLKAIMLFKSSATYRARYDMLTVVNQTIQANFDQSFARAMDNALASARLTVRG